MFIVNQSGSRVVELKEIEIKIYWDEEAQKQVEKILEGYAGYDYRLPAYYTNQKELENKINEYCKDKEKTIDILVNGIKFGEYKATEGKEMFENIITALKNGENFFDMRNIEFLEDNDNEIDR